MYCNRPTVEALWRRSGLPTQGGPKKFEKLDPSQIDPAALKAAQEFSQGDTEHTMLTLCGGHGTAKSHLLESIGWEAVRRQVVTRYSFVPDWLRMMRSAYDWQSEHTLDRVMLEYQELPVLLLDDLTERQATEFAASVLEQLVDYRYREGRVTVISTNLDFDSMARIWGGRLADRIFDIGTGKVKVVEVQGVSYRTGR